MDYETRIKESQDKVYEKAVATKILDLMDKLRTSNNENDRKRWIWELLQNAKDVKNLDRQSVDVIVGLNSSERTLVFKHNGRCFSIDNITFLIEQVSTKERDTQNTEETGKFGTGFLTTHLLSEVVEVRGVVKDDDLPYRKFCITLDRKSTEISRIIDSLKKSIKELRELNRVEDYKNYKEDDFNTSFTYHLDEDGLQTAFIGIEDLKNCLPLTLMFLPALKSVEIEHENTVYYSVSNEELPIEVNDLSLRICSIENCTPDSGKSFDFISLKGLNGEIALPVTQQDNRIYIEDLSPNEVPKIFCDFPLIGSENFGIPFFVNSSYFHPTEPRDGIFLTDKKNPKININKQILKTLTDYYIVLIDYAVIQKWENLHQLANVSIPPEIYWLSTEWYKEYILKPIQDKIYITALVKRENGLNVPLKYENGSIVDIPFNKSKEIREAIWDLVADVKFFILPAKNHIDHWYKIFKNNIWDDCHRLTVSTLSQYISSGCTKLDDLEEKFEITLPIEWLNRYFSLLELSEDNVISFLQKGKYKLIPNQHGEFCLPNDLYNDTGIENSLKDIGSQLVTDYYEILCDTSVKISPFLKTKSQKDIIDEINKSLNSDDTDEDDIRLTCYSLTSLFPPIETPLYEAKNLIFDISKKLFGDNIPEKQFISKWSPDIWEVSDKMQVEFIVYDISDYENLLNLSNSLSENDDQVGEWLSTFVGLIVERDWKDLLGEESPIVPNQNGTFCDVNELFAEGEPIDDSLKNITVQLRRDFRDELIDTRFNKVQIPKNRHLFQKDIAKEIRSLVTPLLSEVSRTPQTQSIFDELILWMDSNQALAQKLFEDLFENRHKFYDDAEVASNLRKVRDLENEVINLRETNSNLKNENEQLKAELEKFKENTIVPDNKDTSLAKKEIDEDFLITYGVTSIEQIESIINDPRISQRYTFSIQQYDIVSKLQYVLEIIERAKNNIREYLESRDEYDCSNWYEFGITHITKILKHNQEIEIIVRPSDNKKVVFYYSDEIQTLSLSNSELWIEDGNASPQQITLGIVLQLEEIDCLYLR